MKRLLGVSLLLGLLIVSHGIVRGEAVQSQERTIVIPETVTVSRPRISLYDLTEPGSETGDTADYLKKVQLGAAPLPGQVRTFSKDYLIFIIRQHSLQQAIKLQMGEEVTVRADAACIRGVEIEAEIQNLLTEKKANVLKRWVELQNLPEEIWLSRGKWEIKAYPIGILPEVGRVLFKVVLSKGKESKSLNISGRIRATALVYRALRDISNLAEVNPADFELIKTELVNGKELVGEIPAYTRIIKKVKKGEILKTDCLQPIPLVCKDHPVKIIVRKENVLIQIMGVAKNDGWLGDDIAVINPSSKKLFRAKVTGNGIAEVNLK